MNSNESPDRGFEFQNKLCFPIFYNKGYTKVQIFQATSTPSYEYFDPYGWRRLSRSGLLMPNIIDAYALSSSLFFFQTKHFCFYSPFFLNVKEKLFFKVVLFFQCIFANSSL